MVRLSRWFLMVGLLAGAILPSVGQGQGPSGALHTPPKGSPERKAIMDALREGDKSNFDKPVVYMVNYLKVHNGWAWTDVTPLDDKGNSLAEGEQALLHYENGKWVSKDLSKVADDPNDPLGAEDPSPRYIRNVLKVYPNAPADISRRSPGDSKASSKLLGLRRVDSQVIGCLTEKRDWS